MNLILYRVGLVGSPGNKSAQGTLLWEAYGKEHMHVQP